MTGRRFSLATTEDNGFTGRDRERFGESIIFCSLRAENRRKWN